MSLLLQLIAIGLVGAAFVAVSILRSRLQAPPPAQPEPTPACQHHCCRCPR